MADKDCSAQIVAAARKRFQHFGYGKTSMAEIAGVLQKATAGLTDISSPAPTEGSPINWLNIFYAAEWAVFAGFAFYLWYRLAKDAWERDVEAFEEAATSASESTASTTEDAD